jgi:uncharacterized membrane protein SirB2
MCIQLNKNHPFYMMVHVVLIDIVDAHVITVFISLLCFVFLFFFSCRNSEEQYGS